MASAKISMQQQMEIEGLLVSWKGKLTWDALVHKIKLSMDLKVTRQTLYTYAGIKAEFMKQKISLKNSRAGLECAVSTDCGALQSQISNLRAEVAVLKKNNIQQLRMIERILSNASTIPNVDLYTLIKVRPEEL
jgi:hypothetical protein